MPLCVHAQSRPADSPPVSTNAAAPSDKFDERLTEVQRILTVDCAASLARELCGDTEGREQLAKHARSALARLAETRKLLDEQSDADAEDSPAENPIDRLDRLEHFGQVFAGLGELDDSEQSRKKLITACGPLASYFDDPDRALGEAAKLWQGAAYRRAGRPDRALQILRPVLTKPADAQLGFWLRVERCRALADRGHVTAAIALCMQLQKRIDDWFDDEHKEARAAATNTLLHLRGSLWKRWSQQLKSDGKSKDADEAATQAREIAETILRAPEKDRCLRITHALPYWEARP